MKNIFIFIGLIVFLTICLLCLVTDTQTNQYSNKQEVLNDNAIQRGWIPNILPNSAYKIIETHNIDTNIVKGSFQYLEKDEQTLLENIKKQENKSFLYDFEIKVDKEKNKVIFLSK